MKTLVTFALVGLLALWVELPFTACQNTPREKSGTCPPNPFRCSVKGKDACDYDSDCQGIKKCCYFNCGKTCRNPQGKPGICPRDICRCSGPQPDECKDDYICPGRKKCCYFCCAMRCKDPKFQED
ncbi:waprin-Enh1-like [Zootoca vivipara]|uniref:waprin-Enh1-like n=1 Tax=Zootoca vivipara TaxID=8524 RepID=UPI00293BCED3|nr:waprin-Enh1-like [Zootoca vivipara]